MCAPHECGETVRGSQEGDSECKGRQDEGGAQGAGEEETSSGGRRARKRKAKISPKLIRFLAAIQNLVLNLLELGVAYRLTVQQALEVLEVLDDAIGSLMATVI